MSDGSPSFVQDFLRNSAVRRPEKAAIVCGDRSITFAELDSHADRFACALQQAGVARGDRVVLFVENSIALATALFGTLRAGGVFAIVNPTTKSDKLRYILDDCGAKAMVASTDLAGMITPIIDQVPGLAAIFWTEEPPGKAPPGRTFPRILAEPRSPPAETGLIDDDLCAIIYTSGSTGRPKGVMLTHRNMTNTAWAISTYLRNVPDDIVICFLPLSFDYGLYQIITGARVGFTVILERSFAFPYDILRQMQRHRVTGLPGVPTVFARLLQMAPFEGLDLSSLRYVSNTGAAFPPAHIRRLRELLPQTAVYSMYGLTECTRVAYLDPSRLYDKIASVGKAMPNCETYIVDENGNRVGPGEVGELVIRGANVMRGYWGKPEETAKCLHEGDIPGEKVLYSGDLFCADEDGFLYFVGRKDDIFKCKGEKISPKEIENVLYLLPEVGEAAVIGVEDPIDGMAIKAIVVPRDGADLTEQHIRRHCRENLESYMVPKFVEIRGSIPRTDSGKLRKNDLIQPEATIAT